MQLVTLVLARIVQPLRRQLDDEPRVVRPQRRQAHQRRRVRLHLVLALHVPPHSTLRHVGTSGVTGAARAPPHLEGGVVLGVHDEDGARVARVDEIEGVEGVGHARAAHNVEARLGARLVH